MVRLVVVGCVLLGAPSARAQGWGEQKTRITTEVLSGVGAGAAGTLGGALLGCMVSGGPNESGGWERCVFGGLVGGGIGGLLGVSFGIFAGGSAFDPHGAFESEGGAGRLGWTMLGTLGGAAIGSAIFFGLNESFEEGAMILATTAVVVGGVVGFELSLAHHIDTQLMVVPTGSGLALGLVASF